MIATLSSSASRTAVSSDRRAIKVLQVLGAMNRGGAETWLLNVARHIDRRRFQLDFLVHTSQPAAYDEALRELGCRIFPCPAFRRPRQYAAQLSAVLRDHGPYEAVHSHVHYFSGQVLRIAHRLGVPLRIAHSHNDTATEDARAGFLRRAYLRLMRRWIVRHATLGVAASEKAAAALFGRRWRDDPRWRILYCGIDPAPFAVACDPREVRAGLGIQADAFVIGHIGRFEPQKNHEFLVNVFREVRSRGRDAWLLLVGQGSLRPAIEAQVAALGLGDRVVFAGPRDDVPRLMLGAMDCMLFPSLYEGLPLVLIEAQAAGLPCVIADTIAPETAVTQGLVQRLPLTAPRSAWSDAILSLPGRPSASQRQAARTAVAQSPLSIQSSVRELERVYAAGEAADAR